MCHSAKSKKKKQKKTMNRWRFTYDDAYNWWRLNMTSRKYLRGKLDIIEESKASKSKKQMNEADHARLCLRECVILTQLA